MGIFDKLFGKEPPMPEPFLMEPTAEMMDEDQYWRLIADSLAAAGEVGGGGL
jgi:hypothetical protein